MSIMKLLLVLSFALGAMALGKSYEGYQVFSVKPHSRHQFDQLTALNEQFNGELDFWRISPILGDSSDVMLPPEYIEKFKNALNSLKIEYSLHTDNVQRLIDDEARAIKRTTRATSLATFDYNVYHTYQEIADWITNFQQANSDGSLSIEGFDFTSYEGRTIKGLKLTTGSGRLGAYTQGGIHAREWVSPATVINLIKKFVDAYNSGDSVVTEFFNEFDWYVIPLLNVDGYHFTRPETVDNDRLWRKNMQDTGSASCKGIDLNRNYGYEWGGDGSSGNKCDNIYRGASPYDAVELKAVTDWLLSLKNGGQNFKIFVDIHSYSQLWLYPFSYANYLTAELPYTDLEDVERVALAAVEALEAVHGTLYYAFQSGNWYPAAGSSEDFGYAVLEAKYSYTIEPRPDGYVNDGFELPQSEIQPTGEETYAAMKELFSQVLGDV